MSEPAFPTPIQREDFREDFPGMTLRDYFAAKTLQAWLSTYANDIDCSAVNKSVVSKFAYGMADAMMKARQP